MHTLNLISCFGCVSKSITFFFFFHFQYSSNRKHKLFSFNRKSCAVLLFFLTWPFIYKMQLCWCSLLFISGFRIYQYCEAFVISWQHFSCLSCWLIVLLPSTISCINLINLKLLFVRFHIFLMERAPWPKILEIFRYCVYYFAFSTRRLVLRNQ